MGGGGQRRAAAFPRAPDLAAARARSRPDVVADQIMFALGVDDWTPKQAVDAAMSPSALRWADVDFAKRLVHVRATSQPTPSVLRSPSASAACR